MKEAKLTNPYMQKNMAKSKKKKKVNTDNMRERGKFNTWHSVSG